MEEKVTPSSYLDLHVKKNSDQLDSTEICSSKSLRSLHKDAYCDAIQPVTCLLQELQSYKLLDYHDRHWNVCYMDGQNDVRHPPVVEVCTETETRAS